MNDSELSPDEAELDAVADLADLTKTIVIDPPLKFRGATYDTMVLAEPNGKMVRQAEAMLRNGGNVESLRRYQFLLISLVSKWPQDVLELLPITKLDEAGTFLSRFTRLGQPTGES